MGLPTARDRPIKKARLSHGQGGQQDREQHDDTNGVSHLFTLHMQDRRAKVDKTLVATSRFTLGIACATRFADAVGPEGGKNLVRAEATAGGERHQRFVGTSRFSSSNQFWTTTICGAVAPASAWSLR